ASGGSLAQEQVGQFRVVFRPNGVLQVSPWGGYSAPPSPTSEITDSAAIEELTGKLYDQIDKNWKEEPEFENELVYRVNLAPDGSIANYEPVNQPGSDYVQDTPLPALTKSNTASSPGNPTSLAPFKVVFKPNGVLQVSPWRGYQ
ncbi:MAG TPA: TonB C-terminal domain-containing protein, partial [Allocoleopsis sp.]